MTLNNIKNGNPISIYANESESTMMFHISLNNVYVSFLSYSMGIFFGLGTLFILMKNAIMIGCFHALFYVYSPDQLFSTYLSIWIHGIIEISTLILSSAAGLHLGRRLLFLTAHSYKTSLIQAGKVTIRFMFGAIPLILIAAFFESFITRYYEISIQQKIIFNLLSVLFVIFYYIFYPNLVAKKFNSHMEIEKLRNNKEQYELRKKINTAI